MAAFLYIFNHAFEVFPISRFLAAVFIKCRIIGVLPVYDMGGADNKVKLVCMCVSSQLFGEIRLQPKLYAEQNPNPVLVGILKTRQVIEVGIGVDKEGACRRFFGDRIVDIHVFRKANMCKPFFHGACNHMLHGLRTVARKRRMQVKICRDCHNVSLSAAA